MTKKYGVLYCLWNDENVVKSCEVIEAKNLREAIEMTECNLELNIVIPLNKQNKKYLNRLLKQ